VLNDIGRHGLMWWTRHRHRDATALASTPREHDANIDRRWPGWALMGPWVTVASIAGWQIGMRMGDWILGASRVEHVGISEPRFLFLTLVAVLSISLGLTYFFWVRGRLASTEVRAEAAMRSAAENQLKLLVSQLEPHMLFNTLANLRVLIGQDPPRAQAMLDHLNGFLRATLDASRVDSHALSSEFARIGDYLELMKVRMGPRLQDALELPVELGTLRVPPLLLQPLVENAIKHGLEPKVAGGRITVSARRDGDSLVLTVRDTGMGLGESRAPGSRFGLSQVRDRLSALYGNAASLDLRRVEDGLGGTLATVRLPVEVGRTQSHSNSQ
jgi:signal transduction histidine kinase